MGADVKQTAEQFESQPEVPALAGPRRQPEVLRRRACAFSKEAADLLLEAGIIRADPRPDQARRHTLPQVKPLEPVAPGTRIVLGMSFFVLFVALWAAVTFSGFVPKTFLADPLTMVRSGWTCWPSRASPWTSA
jgi:hypothetical protein